MEANTITTIDLIKVFRSKNITLFSPFELRKLYDIKSENTLKHLIRRLTKAKIIRRLKRNKYLFLHSQKNISDFEIANFLVIPSYISLETALNLYGILEQFPYKITSLAIGKSKEIKANQKIFSYSHIKKEYFKDFVKRDNFLIASEEKALFDFLYFAYKGLRSSSTTEDLYSYLIRSKVKKYITNNADDKFISFIQKYVKL